MARREVVSSLMDKSPPSLTQPEGCRWRDYTPKSPQGALLEMCGRLVTFPCHRKGGHLTLTSSGPEEQGVLCSLEMGIQSAVTVGTAQSLPARSCHLSEGPMVPEHLTSSQPVVLGYRLLVIVVFHRGAHAGHEKWGPSPRVGAPWRGLAVCLGPARCCPNSLS